MVERVHRTCRFRFANASRNKGLDVSGFYLDIDGDSTSHRCERIGKRRNPRTISEREPFQLGRREFNDWSVGGSLRMPGVRHRIMVNHDHAIARGVHVELNALGAELDGALERGDRILGMSLVCSAVGDPLRRLAALTCGQAFLSVIALCSMSAKQ
jgi:hypothetical protein